MEKLLIHLVRDKFPNAEVEKIFIFTAPVKGAGEHERQAKYLRGLETRSPSIEIVRGKFILVPKIWKDMKTGVSMEVDILEEKQTDVNIGCRIVEDAYTETDSFDMCCLVSNDSDMLYPLEAKRRLKQRILLITPRTTNPKSNVPGDLLKHIPQDYRILTIEKELVEDCQLPDKVGRFAKPKEWR